MKKKNNKMLVKDDKTAYHRNLKSIKRVSDTIPQCAISNINAAY